MSLCVVDGLHCRCQPPEVPCDGVVKLNAEIERMKGEIARVQSLHEGLMKNADKMNDELRAEIAALKVLGTKFLLTIEALENDVNEETEQAWIDAYDAMKALLAKEPTAPQAIGKKEQTP